MTTPPAEELAAALYEVEAAGLCSAEALRHFWDAIRDRAEEGDDDA